MSERTKRLTRRNFLLTLGAGGAATAAAIVASKSPSSTATSPAKDKRATRGYQSSEHVNNYYRTAKV
jgi:shikimate 5-dehydrogenase